jgi:2-polyprenyl-6-methoxyphenol hydroxylase-like FAD-dependent oxidoreductase
MRRILARAIGVFNQMVDKSLAAYEREMIEYGFRAVRASLANMRMVHSEGIGRELTKLGLRLMNLFPHLKGKFTNR